MQRIWCDICTTQVAGAEMSQRKIHWRPGGDRPISRAMRFKLLDDKIFYPLSAVLAIVMVAFALSWPQGLGTRAPPPFGHAEQLPDYYRMVKTRDARLKREAEEKEQRRAEQAAQSSAVSSVLRPGGE